MIKSAQKRIKASQLVKHENFKNYIASTEWAEIYDRYYKQQ